MGFLGIWAFGFVGLLSAAAYAQAPEAPPLDIELSDYGLELHLDYEPGGSEFPILNRLTGHAEIKFTNTGQAPLVRVPLLLNRLMRTSAVADGSGHPLDFSDRLTRIRGWESFQVTETTVSLDPPLEAGATMNLSVDYAGQMAPSTETEMLYVRETLDPAFSIFRIETFAFPIINRPDARVRSPLDPGNAFRQEILVDMPENLVAANGAERFLDDTGGGRRKMGYRTSRPSDVMTFAVAPYGTTGFDDVRFFYFPEDREGAERLTAAARDAFELLAGWFGPRQKGGDGLAFIEIPSDYGSQAVAPTIIQTAAAFRDPERSYEMFHEIAHLWNAKDLTSPSPRWNEGLSTFLQHYIDDRLRSHGVYEAKMAKLFADVKAELGPETPCVGISKFGSSRIMRRQSYGIGGLFFARFQHIFGDRFFDAYRDYYQNYAATGATTQTFLHHLEGRLGERAKDEIDIWFRSCRYLDLIRNGDTFDDFVDLKAGD